MSEMQHSSPEQGFNQLIEETLYQPVPNMDELRERKKGYNELPIDTNHPLFGEPVVDIADYGLAGQAYYSRPNAATQEPVPGAPTTLYVRKSVAETLAKINTSLAHPAITNLFGGEVELYVEDALRPVSLQRHLHDELIPALLRKNHPEMSDDEVAERIKDVIAVPSADPQKPSPHATGGALDVILRYKQATSAYVEGSNVPVGHFDGETSARINPDYFEQADLQTDEDHTAQRNRRAYYAIMTGAAFGVDTGLVNNPTEWWHWGSGDQLSAKVRGEQTAHYSLAEPENVSVNKELTIPEASRMSEEFEATVIAEAETIYPTITTGWGQYSHERADFHQSCGPISEALQAKLKAKGIETDVVQRTFTGYEPHDHIEDLFVPYDASHVFLEMPYKAGKVVIDPTWLQFTVPSGQKDHEDFSRSKVPPVLIFYYETEEQARAVVSSLPYAHQTELLRNYLGFNIKEYREAIEAGQLIVKSETEAEWAYPSLETNQ